MENEGVSSKWRWLKNYDLIFLARYNRKGTLSDAAKQNLLDFISSGKGFVMVRGCGWVATGKVSE